MYKVPTFQFYGVAIDVFDLLGEYLKFTHKYRGSKSWGIQLGNGQFYGTRFDVCYLLKDEIIYVNFFNECSNT